MSAALLTALLGFGWAAGGLSRLPPSAPFLIGGVFFGLYTAHVTDSYVDVVKRGDKTPTDYPLLFRDSTGLIAPGGYPPLRAASALLCLAFVTPVAVSAGPAPWALLVLGLVLALTYSRFLDRSLLGVTLGYPIGVVAILTAAFLAAGGGLDLRFGALCVSLFLALVGTKVRSDILDIEDDRRIAKRTVPVLLGERGAWVAGYGLGAAGLGVAAAIPFAFSVSPLFALPALAAGALWVATARDDAFRASMAMAGALFFLLVFEVALVGSGGAAPSH